MLGAFVVAMVEYIFAIILRENLAAMSWSEEEVTLLAHDNGRSISFGHRSTLSVAEDARQLATSADKEFVGVVLIPTRAYEHIPISVVVV